MKFFSVGINNDEFIREIVEGRTMKKVTMGDIATTSGFSKGLVSRTLSGKYGVSEATRQKIYAAAHELGYDLESKKYRQNAKKEVTLYITSHVLSKEMYWQLIISSLERRLNKAGIHLGYQIFSEDKITASETKRITDSFNTDGRIVIHHNTKELMGLFLKKDLPTVIIDPKYYDNANYYQIKTSNFESAYQATKYFIANGHKKLLYYGSVSFASSFKERYEGMKKCAHDNAANGVEFYEVLFDNENYEFEDNASLMKTLVDSQITAVMCSNDLMAISCYKAIKDIGKEVFNDISVIGFDNIYESKILSPDLTTCNVPRKLIGEEAAKYLIDAINQEAQKYSSISLQCEFIERSSVRDITKE